MEARYCRKGGEVAEVGCHSARMAFVCLVAPKPRACMMYKKRMTCLKQEIATHQDKAFVQNQMHSRDAVEF
eukprot:1142447-Pelagomonas_calceolata.AAC.4